MLAELQRLLLLACGQPEPTIWLRARLHAAGPELTAAERAMLANLDADGLRLTALLVHKLRFERLLRGDPALRTLFAADPVGFTRRFDRYVATTAATAVFPAEEASLFAGRSPAS
ncbi:MAG: hypothetical protein IPK26_31075 [Planctomycetes bacterium]|nr:hypothetical protein [Planctomycetota bacterium]